MLLASIGLPPAAEVDRAALAQLVQDGLVDRFEVQPDRVVFYLWPRAGKMNFSFFFRPRLAMTARTAASEIFDYYNPDIRAIQAPQTFAVRP